MGLCKCPKRQVTNQFCFEHRVNVCEHCMVQNHPKCIVQSYIQWLKDSDYVSNCILCSTTLDNGECVRLICYHVFHWECLNARQTALPSDVSPNAHKCPTCERTIIPPSNLISPIGDALKVCLSQSSWGCNALGPTVLSNDPSSTSSTLPLTASTSSSLNSASISTMTKVHHANIERAKPNGAYDTNYDKNKTDSPHSVLLMDAFNPPNDTQANSRRPLIPRQSSIGGSDCDDNKYKRRTPTEILSRWSRRFYAPSSRPPWRRTWFLVVIGIFIFVTIIYLMAVFGRNSPIDSVDESWNKNPNAHY